MDTSKDLSYKLAVETSRLCRVLMVERREYVLSRQLLRSSTSVGANIRESVNGESSRDFIHKLSIAQKECDETIYWLEVLLETKYITHEEYAPLVTKANSILRMLKSSIITMKKKEQEAKARKR